jgi:hypothetical protein
MSDPPKKLTGKVVFRFCGGVSFRQTAPSDHPQAADEAQCFWAETWRETIGRRFDVPAANVPPAAALPAAHSRPVLHPLTIRLSDGSSLDIDPDDWPTLGNPVGAMRDLGQHATEHLLAGKYDDGRTLVYVVIEQLGVAKTIAGEMLPAGTADFEAAVRRVSERFDISTRLVDQCLDSIKRSSN